MAASFKVVVVKSMNIVYLDSLLNTVYEIIIFSLVIKADMTRCKRWYSVAWVKHVTSLIFVYDCYVNFFFAFLLTAI